MPASLTAIVAAAAAARQWLRSRASVWLSFPAVRSSPIPGPRSSEQCGAREREVKSSIPGRMQQEEAATDDSLQSCSGENRCREEELESEKPPRLQEEALESEKPPRLQKEALEEAISRESVELVVCRSPPPTFEEEMEEEDVDDGGAADLMKDLVERSGSSRSRELKSILSKHRRNARSRIIGRVLESLGDADAAIDFFRWCASGANFKHTTYTINALLLTLIKLGRASKAHEIYSKEFSISCQPDRLAVSTILYGLVDSGNLHSACEFADKIKGGGIFPYGKVLGTLIQALCAAGDIDRALRIGRELTVDPADYIFTYSILIHTLCKLGETKAAWTLFHELREKGGALDTQVYATLLHGVCRAGELHKASAVLSDMASRGCHLDAVVFNTLIHGFCQSRKLDHALRLLHVMASNGHSACVVTYTTLINGLCKARDFDAARALLRAMADAGCAPNVVTYTALIDGLCKARRLGDAILAVQSMLDAGCEPDLVTYNALLHGLCAAGKLDEAESLLEELARRGFAPNHITYCTMIIGNCRGRRLDQARHLLREMIAKGSACNLVVYVDCIHGFCEARCRSRAFQCFAGREVGELFEMIERMVAGVADAGGIAFEGESFFDPISRLERAEQMLEFMFHKGCVGSDERYCKIQAVLSLIRRLKTPADLQDDDGNRDFLLIEQS